VISLANGNNIIVIDQAKKKMMDFVREVSFAIVDIRILIDLIVIEIPKAALLVGTD